MTEHEDDLAQRIRSSSDELRLAPPDPSKVIAFGRRRRRKDRMLASGAAVVIAVGVLLPIRALLPIANDSPPITGSDKPATSCFGYEVDIYAVEDGQTYEGTSGDDIVIQGGTSIYRDNGGLDFTCNLEGEPMGVSTDDNPELMKIDNAKELEDAVRRLIDAEPAAVPGRLTPAETLALSPLDPEEVATAGWPATVDEIKLRVIAWYQDQEVADAPEADLERAIDLLTEAVGDPLRGEEPERLLYVHELGYRRESVCRSLAPDHPFRVKEEYCSQTSAPGLDEEAVPWADS